MTTATEYALDRLTRVLGFTTEEAIEIIARRQAADDRVKAEIKAERIERAARIRIEQRGSKEALVLTEGIIRRAFYDAAECFARGDSEGVKEHQDRAEFNARIHKAIERIAA